MKLLALDTCLGSCSAAVHDTAQDRVLARARILLDKGHAERIAPMVQDVMRKAELTFENLTAIAVTTGPGTFTGVRIGIGLAQGLALARNTPVIGISTMLATAAPLLGGGRDVVVAHMAGATGKVYVQRFSPEGAARGDIELLAPASVMTANTDLIAGTGATGLKGRHETVFDLPDAAHFASWAARLPSHPALALKPLYIREPDAKPQRAAPARPVISTARVGPLMSSLLSELHGRGFAEGWSATALHDMLQTPGTLALLAETDGSPAGFILVRAVADEAEILTLVTDPRYRRRGVARKLLNAAVMHLKSLRVNALFLEVADDNVAARALYDTCGFHLRGRRKGYYATTGASRTDALILRRDIA